MIDLDDIERIARLRAAIDLDRALIANLETVVKIIPPCPVHGDYCIPYALEWVAWAKVRIAELTARLP